MGQCHSAEPLLNKTDQWRRLRRIDQSRSTTLSTTDHPASHAHRPGLASLYPFHARARSAFLSERRAVRGAEEGKSITAVSLRNKYASEIALINVGAATCSEGHFVLFYAGPPHLLSDRSGYVPGPGGQSTQRFKTRSVVMFRWRRGWCVRDALDVRSMIRS